MYHLTLVQVKFTYIFSANSKPKLSLYCPSQKEGVWEYLLSFFPTWSFDDLENLGAIWELEMLLPISSSQAYSNITHKSQGTLLFGVGLLLAL